MKYQEVRLPDKATNVATLFDAVAGVNRAALAGVLLLGACAPVGEPELLSVVASEPASGAIHVANLPVRIAFDRYLDPALPLDGAAVLSSAELTAAARVRYDPVGRALLVFPTRPLRPGLGYTLTLPRDGLRGFAGEQLDFDFVLGFMASPATTPAVPLLPPDFERDLSPLFEAKCGCHGPEPAVFPPLDPTALIGIGSQRQPERVLVEPGHALRSYLVQRVLEGYPGVRGLPMPVEAPLTDAEQRLIVSWVEGL